MRLLLFVLTALGLMSQTVLTLAEAQRLALQNHPALQAAQLGAQALGERAEQSAAAWRPVASASMTGVGSLDASRVAAGALNNPVIYSRLATGVTVSQLVADFGRTSQLTASAKLAAQAEAARVKLTRADILLNVQRSYVAALRSRAVVGIAESTVAARQLLVDQVTALVNAQLKSGLDLSFASTNLAEAKLLVSAATNEYQAAQALLSEAMGFAESRTFTLAEETMPVDEKPTRESLTAQALKDRPELVAGRLDIDASRRFALAENALKYPVVSAVGTAGVIPFHASQLSSRYLAGGVNITLPFLNGGLFKSRQREAEIRARQAEQRVKQIENAVSRDVAVAMLDVTTALERIGLAEQLIAQASQALELAQSRYDLGLSSIVELSQAQLAKTNAEIQNTQARYDYQLRRAILDYRAGRL
jgi:outer membrane protein